MTEPKPFQPNYAVKPGKIVQMYMRGRGLSPAGLAKGMGHKLQTVNDMIRGKTPIDKAIAADLARVLGSPPTFWLQLQSNFESTKARLAKSKRAKSVATGVQKSLSQSLRAAIETSDRSRYAIAKEAGLSPINLDRFLAGGDLRLQSADKIAVVLGLRLQVAHGRQVE